MTTATTPAFAAKMKLSKPNESTTMQAILQSHYGDESTLSIGETNKPTPAKGEVLVKVKAASLNKGDWHMMTGKPYMVRMMAGLRKPKHAVPGQEFAGVVEACGEGVSEFQVGDEVFGEATHGAFAEYVCVPATRIAHKPSSASFEQAAALPSGAITALQGLRDTAAIKQGDNVLIIGASGGVGIFALQLAKHLGASVSAVCSAKNADLVRSLGAQEVIDYAKEDFAQLGKRFDVILDLSGRRSLRDMRKALAPRGTLVACAASGGAVLGPIPRIFSMMFRSMLSKHTLTTFFAEPNTKDLEHIATLFESGELTPVISRTLTLDQIPQGMRELGTGHCRAKLCVSMED